MRFLLKSLLAVFLFPVLCFSREHYEVKMLRGAMDGTVRQWETVEIGIQLPNMERTFLTFLGDPSRGSNPYTASFLHMQLTCHGKTYTVPAFYMQDAVPDHAANRFVTAPTAWPWRVRFAVPDTGVWQCILLTGDPVAMAVAQPTDILFTCLPGKERGHLRIASDNQYLCFSDGTPFFAIGQNIAWSDPVLRGKPGPYPVYSSGYYDTFHYLHNLADNGGNFIRIVMAPWSTGIEWERAGVYSQERAWVMDSIVKICEARGIFLYICLEMHSGYTVRYDAEYNWNAHPYKKALGLGSPVEALTNDSAVKLFRQKLRYFFARWCYSPNVAVVEFLSEMNGWDGYYENEETFIRWHESTCNYVRQDIGDTLKLLTTCFGVPPFGRMYDLPGLQLTTVHSYTNDLLVARKRYNFINRRHIAVEMRGMRTRWDKPFIFGEQGMISGPVNACDPDDWEHCNDLEYHNALWSTSFMGGFGAGLNWWQWNNDAYRAANFPALRWFIDSVATQLHWCHDNRQFRGNGLEAYYALDAEGLNGYGWIHNTSYWWGNNTDSCLDRSGKKMRLPKDDDKAITFENREGKMFTIGGLEPRMKYSVTFYNTRTPGVIIKTIVLKSTAFGKVAVSFPGNVDCAFAVSVLTPPS